MITEGNTFLLNRNFSAAVGCFHEVARKNPELGELMLARIDAAVHDFRIDASKCNSRLVLKVGSGPDTTVEDPLSDYLPASENAVATLDVAGLATESLVQKVLTLPATDIVLTSSEPSAIAIACFHSYLWGSEIRGLETSDSNGALSFKNGAVQLNLIALPFIDLLTIVAFIPDFFIGLHNFRTQKSMSAVSLLKSAGFGAAGQASLIHDLWLWLTRTTSRELSGLLTLVIAKANNPQADEYGIDLSHALIACSALKALRDRMFDECRELKEVTCTQVAHSSHPALPQNLRRLLRCKPFGEICFEEQNEPVVTILIPVFGKLDYTLGCLRSIVDSAPLIPYEVVVVDDCSPDDSFAALGKIRNLVLLKTPKNLGFLRACNFGSQHARGKYVFFLNNDTEVCPGWLDESIRLLEESPDIGLVGSKLVYPDGRLQEAGGIVWRDATAWNFGRLADPDLPEFSYVKDVDYCSGAALAVRRNLLEVIGGFDERYCPAYYEDTDLAFEIRRAGYRTVYQPKSLVVHHEGISHGTESDSGVKAFQTRNREKFLDKWSDVLKSQHVENGSQVFRAKDRSIGRPVVLVLDHHIPKPDCDAGSRSMWHLLRCLVQQGMTVKFWPHNHFYNKKYAEWLEQIGIEVIAGDRYVNTLAEWLSKNVQHIDRILLSRPNVALSAIKALGGIHRVPLIYYGHDIHHQRLERQYRLTQDFSLLEKIEKVRQAEFTVWQAADAIYYPSDEEEAYVRDWLLDKARSKTPCRTIPLFSYDRFRHVPGVENRRDIMFVAGFGHPPNVDAARWFVETVMPKLLERRPDVRILLVGSSPSVEVRSLACDHVVVTGFVSEQQLTALYDGCRVAVAPLRFGGGMKGKIVEAFFHGLPCVTTTTGAQGFSDAQSFLSVTDDPGQMADEIVCLMEDDSLWTARSAQGVRHVMDCYSAEALWNVISPDFQVGDKRVSSFQ